ncbi:hypothetical protein ACFYNO_40180 [Kitasatospora sp. NPDC006697]|uniref:hypothetical protein n=1 Tax=Kitasatospora sp. NPDC006697 TaxID=3364020 RepID=UPI00368E3BED
MLPGRRAVSVRTGNCPEFTRVADYVLLRDDADLASPPSVWTLEEIRALFSGVKDGEFDRLLG